MNEKEQLYEELSTQLAYIFAEVFRQGILSPEPAEEISLSLDEIVRDLSERLHTLGWIKKDLCAC
jgi:hypothetical protein